MWNKKQDEKAVHHVIFPLYNFKKHLNTLKCGMICLFLILSWALNGRASSVNVECKINARIMNVSVI